jgi:hypothetical protein
MPRSLFNCRGRSTRIVCPFTEDVLLRNLKMLFAVLLCCYTVSSLAVEVGGVMIQDTATVAGQHLGLNGAGLRKKFFVKVYAAGLYLPEKTADAQKAITMPGPKRITMQFIYDGVEAGKITKGWTEGFEKNSTDKQLQKLQSRLNAFNAFFEDMKKGDRIIIDYLPESGTQVTVKGQLKGVIPGEDFMQALLRVWLGEEPADEGLRAGMLGED